MEIDPDELGKIKRINQWLLQRMKELREMQGFTQADLGERMGDIDRSRISDTESGKYGVKLSTVLRFLHALNVDFETFSKGCPGWRSKRKPKCIVVDENVARESLGNAGFNQKQVDKILDTLHQGS